MTHIASPAIYKTKKSFVEAVKADPSRVYLMDPSIYNPVEGYVADIMEEKAMITVTNHPKRSWYACIEIKNGKIKIS